MKSFAYWCSKVAYDDPAEAAQEAEAWTEPRRQVTAYACPHWQCRRHGYWHLRTKTKRRRREAARKRRRESAPHQAWENEGGGSTVRWLATGQANREPTA